MTRNEIVYDITVKCVGLLESLDQIKDLSIYRQQLKKAIKEVEYECNKQIDSQFNSNPNMLRAFTKDQLLENRVLGLSLSERLAVDSFIDSLNRIRENEGKID